MPRRLPLFASLALTFLAPLGATAQQADRAADTSSAPAEQPRPSEVVREIELTATRVQRTLDETRRAGRTQHASCVDEQLSQITATLRLALERTQRSQRYERERNVEMAERERALVARLLPRARELEREARRCVDPDADLESGRTRVTTIIDANVPRDAVREPRRREGAVHE
ncbi:hypothetical protein [Sandaracinus amylolyticus]|uniref:hypothetical protein n=1 Tax=Sandaracinus amylolyticus TaxID=927083 RepID=UPI001F213A24|nr:hypothetical protein [Sandaracinus amylolyticus]UJR86111.1 Hypothetical protein I5071_81920 [Sandaracinus amylolyticus]